MERRILGKTGYEVSEIGLGTWQLGESFGALNDQTAEDILKTARRLEVNFWDTADVYGGGQSESRIGGFKDKTGVFVATKLGRGGEFPGMKGYSRKNVKESLSGSLKRIGGETLDLAQLRVLRLQHGDLLVQVLLQLAVLGLHLLDPSHPLDSPRVAATRIYAEHVGLPSTHRAD